MKTKIQLLKLAIIIAFIFSPSLINGQAKRKTLTVLNIDTQGISYSPEQMGNIVRIEMGKLDTFEIVDQYDVKYLLDKNSLDITHCFGKICLVEVGETINSDMMLSGSAQLIGETLILTLRLVNVNSQKTEITHVREFLKLPNEIQLMVRVMLNEMFEIPNDPELVTKLTKKDQLESSTTNPNENRLNSSGPRMGYTYFTGEAGDILSRSKSNGGYDVMPALFHFGYQYEIQYLNEGNFQALFEVIPMLTGLDQNMLIPSLTIMNGLRSNKNGWEIGFGPTVSIAKYADVYSNNGAWTLSRDVTNDTVPLPSPKWQMDSRGTYRLSTAFVFGVGKTFRSGKINIPVNAYVIPGKRSWRFGLSFGYNAKN